MKRLDGNIVPSIPDTIYSTDEFLVVVRNYKVEDCETIVKGDFIVCFETNNSGQLKKETLDVFESDGINLILVENVETPLGIVEDYIKSNIDKNYKSIPMNYRTPKSKIISNIFEALVRVDNNVPSKRSVVDIEDIKWIVKEVLSTNSITILTESFKPLGGVITNVKFPLYMVKRIDSYTIVTRVDYSTIETIYNPTSRRHLTKSNIEVLRKIREAGVDIAYYDNDLETIRKRRWSEIPRILECIYSSADDILYKSAIKYLHSMSLAKRNIVRLPVLLEEALNISNGLITKEVCIRISNDTSKNINKIRKPRKLEVEGYTLTLTGNTIQMIGNGVNYGQSIDTLQDIYNFIYMLLGNSESDVFIGYEEEIEYLYYGWREPTQNTGNIEN